MAIIKSYTDIEQSRKLVEILPLESADMCYPLPYEEGDKPLLEQGGFGSTPCWSLAALLDILPSGYVIVKNYHSLYFAESRDHEKSTNIFNNPVDVCVAMIEKLNELNLL